MTHLVDASVIQSQPSWAVVTPSKRLAFGSPVPSLLPGAEALAPGDFALHATWGVGRVESTKNSVPRSVLVRWRDGLRETPITSVRRVVTRTVLGKLIEDAGLGVSAWTIRKAEEQGTIRADAIGRCAGHAVHYYDPTRMPAIVSELSQRDSLKVGTLVFHSKFGAGKIESVPTNAQTCSVRFFTNTQSVVVVKAELRLLISSCALAARLGVPRKTFARLAPRIGIHPDYCPEGRLRQFYDEERVVEIRSRWAHHQHRSAFEPGLVSDIRGEIAYVESLNGEGMAILRYLEGAAETRRLHVSELHRLGSTRELARSEGMSRYKLCRLLHACDVTPVHKDGKTIYYDLHQAREALKDRREREHSAVSLDVLAQRTGVSTAILARKVQQGCLRTIDVGRERRVDRRESDRVEQVVKALQDPDWSLEGLGICRLYPRGTVGHEVVRWDISALVKAAQRCTQDQRKVLFDQVAWLCHGAGRTRFRQVLDGFLDSREAYAQDCGLRASTQLLLELLSHLTGDFDEYRCRLLLVASGRIDPFDSIDKYLRNAAKISGCNIDGRTHDQLRGAVERSVSVLLTGVSDLPICDEHDRALLKASHVYANDDYVPGAVVLSCRRQKIESGIIVRVEQQAWNAMLSRWDKQLVVRFSDRERQLSPHTPGCQNTLPMPIVVRAEDTRAVLKSLNGRGGTPQILPQAGPYWNDRKAS